MFSCVGVWCCVLVSVCVHGGVLGCVCGSGQCIWCGGWGIESKREIAVEVAVMLWWLLLLLMGHVVSLACAAWFADVGVCGVVSPGGWWPGWWGCGWTVYGGVCAVWRRMG